MTLSAGAIIRRGQHGFAPIKAFGSIPVRQVADGSCVASSNDRYALGDRDKLKVGTDGSIELYLQHERPSEDKVANWLPTPADGYSLSSRVYWPEQVALDDEWTPPAAKLNAQ